LKDVEEGIKRVKNHRVGFADVYPHINQKAATMGLEVAKVSATPCVSSPKNGKTACRLIKNWIRTRPVWANKNKMIHVPNLLQIRSMRLQGKEIQQRRRNPTFSLKDCDQRARIVSIPCALRDNGTPRIGTRNTWIKIFDTLLNTKGKGRRNGPRFDASVTRDRPGVHGGISVKNESGKVLWSLPREFPVKG